MAPVRARATALPTWVLAAISAAALWPLAGAAWSVIVGLSRTDASISGSGWAQGFGASLGWGSLVAAIATAAAWPAAWATRRMSSRFFALFLVPLLMPSYLAYAGWGLLRAPDTRLGAFLMRGPIGADGQSIPGPNPYPIIAGHVLAVGGLALWAWPIAAMILGAAVRRLDGSVLESLRLEPMSTPRRWITCVAMLRWPALAAFGAVLLVMLGSAVPFHLAQIETFAIRVWRLLDETPRDQAWRVWAACWPLVGVAIVGGLLAGRRAGVSFPSGQSSDMIAPRRAASAALVAATAVWSASVLGPIVLFATSLKNPHSLLTFWRVAGAALLNSLAIAATVALVAGVAGACVWFGASSRPGLRRATLVFSYALLVAGLLPGVLIGSATAAAWNRLGVAAPPVRAVSDSGLLVVLGHLARYTFVPALMGLFLAGTEPREARDLRFLDGAETFRGWARACLPLQVGPLAACSLACLALSLHEIESAVFLQPPGPGHFATFMLQLLHFERRDDLCAAGLYVTLGGAVVTVGFISLSLLGRRPDSV